MFSRDPNAECGGLSLITRQKQSDLCEFKISSLYMHGPGQPGVHNEAQSRKIK